MSTMEGTTMRLADGTRIRCAVQRCVKTDATRTGTVMFASGEGQHRYIVIRFDDGSVDRGFVCCFRDLEVR